MLLLLMPVQFLFKIAFENVSRGADTKKMQRNDIFYKSIFSKIFITHHFLIK